MTTNVESEVLRNPELRKFSEPILMFDVSSKGVQDPLEGLQRYGPFDKNVGRIFDKVRVIVFSPPNTIISNRLETLVNGFVNGIGSFRGFETEYGFSDVEIEYVSVPDAENLADEVAKDLIRDTLPGSMFNRTSKTRTIVLGGS